MNEKPQLPKLSDPTDDDETATRAQLPDAKILAEARRSDRKIPVEAPTESNRSGDLRQNPPIPREEPED
jgi:hypothetical protein